MNAKIIALRNAQATAKRKWVAPATDTQLERDYWLRRARQLGAFCPIASDTTPRSRNTAPQSYAARLALAQAETKDI
jgi:hypothetical protein